MSITVEHLTKSYKIKNRSAINNTVKHLVIPQYSFTPAVNDISFTIQTGDIVGFIGANGAGKSTTIKMLTGILTPDKGIISINGLTFKKNRKEIMQKIGVVFGQRSVLCWDIPVIESFKLFKDMYRIPENIYRENIEIFSDILNLPEFIYKPPRLLSLGQRMKADLAAALLYNPEVLFLDEPTIGIDVLAKAKIRDFIIKINQVRKTTIILTTHDISDIESLCQKMLIIDKGTLLYNGTLEELKRKNASSHNDDFIPKKRMNDSLEQIIRTIYEGGGL
ncbi:ATP-binding cassette domain-containing protein [Coprococcus sp. NSJ-10]|uniref:ATP-binding cassette domain-containing protein n=1 Tax=Coprococcus hominis (ex Liu et al. 2022) TaxID=2763039 RepID=A0A8I0AM51_9FIRM|nr:ATP-binding cassette domain-containing protein [Coprococcus hominis (ex Liu et al. 2022)]MBC5662916.1 ATP-binding cassette domain-containing protein [Coprococcus hominis (ex Liu et al. 2022)]